MDRTGDRVVATSATLGDVLWKKNTVDGILSAVGTRLVFSNTVTLRVERALDAQQLAAARYVLVLGGGVCVVEVTDRRGREEEATEEGRRPTDIPVVYGSFLEGRCSDSLGELL